MSIYLLIQLLEALDVDNTMMEADVHPFHNAVTYLADRCLITRDGRPDIDAITTVKMHGFNVRPGESDSFGWLSGVIELPTRKQSIVFG
jgi:hypothetical protein